MYQNEQADLPSISSTRFENIFHVNQTETNGYYFYNILKTIRVDTDNIDNKYIYLHRVNRSAPYTSLSYQLYGNIDLWWLICVINNIDNPIEFIEPGTLLKIIKKQYVSVVIDAIRQQLQ